LYEHAVRLGHTAVAELLARYGAERQDIVLDDEDQFVAASLRLDREEGPAHPGAASRIPALVKGNICRARQDRADVVAWLLDLGTPTNVEDANKQRPACMSPRRNDAAHVAELLIERWGRSGSLRAEL